MIVAKVWLLIAVASNTPFVATPETISQHASKEACVDTLKHARQAIKAVYACIPSEVVLGHKMAGGLTQEDKTQ